MNIFNKQEITTGDRIVAYIDGKCFIRDGRGKPETLVVENFRLDDLIEYIKKKMENKKQGLRSANPALTSE